MAVAGLTSVVVVSHRSLATLPDCLAAVLASTAPVEVIAVDNGSDDGSAALLAGLAGGEPRLRVIANADNRGFGAACNQGAQQANGDALLLLNPDAFVPVDALARLRTVLGLDPTIGLLGCSVVDAGGRPHGPQRRREPTWRRSLMSLTGLARLERRWPALAGVERPPPATMTTVIEAVDAVNGALMLLPTGLFRSLGGFDEGFRLHAEDLDLCRRVRAAGRTVAIAPAIAVRHIGGVSGRRRPLWVEWQKTRSMWRYFRKHQPAAGLPLRAAVALGLGLRLLLRAPLLLLRRR
jgi:N-acetylglucosaminyl-diphospho-decaprenol L-rhamnosyltransferase